jgi:Escherichia/Staphylococcus phage prohead protease
MERRAYGRQGLELRDAEQRILGGVLVPFDTPTKIGGYTETFQRGAFADADPASVPLLVGHDHAALPVGVTLTLDEGDQALTGEWRVADTQAGEELLSLARSQVPISLSVGFRPLEDRWSPDRSRVTRIKAELGEVSAVGLGAYETAKVTSVRADEHVSAHRLTIARLIRP